MTTSTSLDAARTAPILRAPDSHDYHHIMLDWLAEDIGAGDLTSDIFVDPQVVIDCTMHAREPMTVCGVTFIADIFRLTHDYYSQHEETLDVTAVAHDGQTLAQGDAILTVRGNARLILKAERTALNLLSYLSGIATHTAACVAAVNGTAATILDTRKTLPGYRELSKYAVRCGGGQNHRMRLDDGVMIKDNHIAAAGGISAAITHARRHVPALTKIEIECDRLDQLDDALAAGADVIMLDNMTPQQVTQAVTHVAGRAALEASGGMTLGTLTDYAHTGVDYISLGALTHSVRAVDIGLDHVALQE